MISYEITDAPPPFDDEDADVIVRTCDGVDFRVFKLILKLASPVFKDMFKMPQPAPDDDDEQRDGLPIVRVEEQSSVFGALLRFCYPQVDDPPIGALDEIVGILRAALKYDLDVIARRMKQLLLQPKFLESDPVRIYAIACHLKLREHAEFAARYSLRTPILEHPSKALEMISGLEYHRLLVYHKQCGELASSVVANLDLLPRSSYVWYKCRHSTCPSVPSMHSGNLSLTVSSPRKWWVDYLVRLDTELLQRPCGDTALDSSIRKGFLSVAAKCPTCSLVAAQDLAHFCKVLAFTIDNEIIDNAYIELPF